MTGRKPTSKGTSVYAHIPLGVNEIKNTGKYMARVLGKEDPDEYTGMYIINILNIIVYKDFSLEQGLFWPRDLIMYKLRFSPTYYMTPA